MAKTNSARSKDNFLAFGEPLIGEAEITEVVDTLKSGWLGTGPRVAEFESAFSDYKGGGHPVALNSCTAALHLSLIAAGVGPGDEVITTAMTFCATVNAIIHSGATPVLTDIDPDTMNISPGSVRDRVTTKTRAIVPVHFAGRPCDMDAIMSIASQHGLKVIEDCAHAIETEYKGQKAGTIGDFGCFSFYATKNIVTGEGGMVLAREVETANRIKSLALHGMSKDAYSRFGAGGYKHYQVVEAGFKYNMMDLQAAIGIHQLARVEEYWQRRQDIWRMYDEAFSSLPLELPAQPEDNTRHACHLYTLLVDEKEAGITRDGFLDAMTANNIGVGVHYLSIPEHPYYQDTFGWVPDDYPAAMKVGRQTLSLPLSPKLAEEDAEDVIRTVRSVLGQ
jgi:dTDP-4-amino-4,6-dideoxygalactose transaminase